MALKQFVYIGAVVGAILMTYVGYTRLVYENVTSSEYAIMLTGEGRIYSDDVYTN